MMAAFFARLGTPSVYAKALAEDPRAARALVALFGASSFLGASMIGHPELADRLLFGRGAPTAESARRDINEELASIEATGEDVDAEDFAGALRRAKGRVTIEVGLADLAGELTTRACTLVLSALADATLDRATRFALRAPRAPSKGALAVIAMGKLGGGEIGYGSDLDLFFVYEDSEGASAADDEVSEAFVRTAQRVMRLLSAPHGDGPGYELDTRLRPSGNQGLLVVSLEAFARYHGVGERGRPDEERSAASADSHDWERQALLKARACAGDAALAAKVVAVAAAAAYERAAPPAERVHHLRMRMERELAGERCGRYDLKVGRGGLVDVEFAVQWLQMKYGRDARVRTTDTEAALTALDSCGYLGAPARRPLARGVPDPEADGAAPARPPRDERPVDRGGGARNGAPRAPDGHARRSPRHGDGRFVRALRRGNQRRSRRLPCRTRRGRGRATVASARSNWAYDRARLPPYDVKIRSRDSTEPPADEARPESEPTRIPLSPRVTGELERIAGVNLSLDEVPTQLEIRDSHGTVQVHDLPTRRAPGLGGRRRPRLHRPPGTGPRLLGERGPSAEKEPVHPSRRHPQRQHVGAPPRPQHRHPRPRPRAPLPPPRRRCTARGDRLGVRRGRDVDLLLDRRRRPGRDRAHARPRHRPARAPMEVRLALAAPRLGLVRRLEPRQSPRHPRLLGLQRAADPRRPRVRFLIVATGITRPVAPASGSPSG